MAERKAAKAKKLTPRMASPPEDGLHGKLADLIVGVSRDGSIALSFDDGQKRFDALMSREDAEWLHQQLGGVLRRLGEEEWAESGDMDGEV